MALSNYTELKQAVIDQSHRGDLDLKIDDFILLAETEAKANRDEPLNMNLSETTFAGVSVVDSALIAIPSNYSSSRSLRVTYGDQSTRLVYKTPANLVRRTGSGTPYSYTIMGGNLEFDIAFDAVYTVTMQYLADFTALTSAAPTNSVLTKYPNIYLFGCLKQANIYANDEAEALKYDALFMDAIRSANMAEARGRYGDSPSIGVNWAP